MPVLLNGGGSLHAGRLQDSEVPLVDACVTEWRRQQLAQLFCTAGCHSLMPVLLNGGGVGGSAVHPDIVPLVDACVTEWRCQPERAYLFRACATR